MGEELNLSFEANLEFVKTCIKKFVFHLTTLRFRKVNTLRKEGLVLATVYTENRKCPQEGIFFLQTMEHKDVSLCHFRKTVLPQ